MIKQLELANKEFLDQTKTTTNATKNAHEPMRSQIELKMIQIGQ